MPLRRRKMPARMPARLRPDRAKRTLQALGWTTAGFLQRLDRIAGTVHATGGGYLWFTGARDFPDAAVVFLRCAVRLERRERYWRRRLAARGGPRSSGGEGSAAGSADIGSGRAELLRRVRVLLDRADDDEVERFAARLKLSEGQVAARLRRHADAAESAAGQH